MRKSIYTDTLRGLWEKLVSEESAQMTSQHDVMASLPTRTYGFIGIGVMGYGMAQNLRAKISPASRLVICDISREQVNKFLNETAGSVEAVETPREVTEQADIIITMLPKGPHVKKVFTDPQTGLLAAQVGKSIFLMESSTIDTATSCEVNRLATEAGHRFVDAPVSGGPHGAYAGTLTFMIGGSQELFDEVKPLAEIMGKKESIFHCGNAGAKLATKQINNFLSAVCALGTAEAFNMGRLYGLDPNILASVVNVSTGMNYNSSAQNPVKGVTPTSAAAKDFEGGFSIELCRGVLDMAIKLGKDVGVRSVLGDLVASTFAEASQDPRCKGKDYRSIYRWIADL